MIVLGLILVLLASLVTFPHAALVGALGVILLVVGVVLLVFGEIGRPVGGRRRWY